MYRRSRDWELRTFSHTEIRFSNPLLTQAIRNRAPGANSCGDAARSRSVRLALTSRQSCPTHWLDYTNKVRLRGLNNKGGIRSGFGISPQ
ncbi:hypothetical protein DP113_20050 [Brasilonema octagenarum UFV-E1]|nr:hypothetical protein DP113_20050 [Brasilonema octagenarum UFV-E1]